jgi:hypothetical protein
VILGVLSMVFGGLVALWNGGRLLFMSLSTSFFGNLGRLAASAPRRPGQPDPTAVLGRMTAVMKELAPYTNAITAGKLLFSVAIIIIGYGLYKRQRWSRSGSVAWGALALLFLAAELLVTIGIIQPRTMAVMHEALASSGDAAGVALMQAFGRSQSAITIGVNVLLFAPFPIVLLALCGRRSAAADFVD